MHRRLFCFVALGALSVACSDTTQAPVVTSVVVTPDSVGLPVGDTLTFVAVAYDASGNALTDQSFVWTINDQTVATLGSDGKVEAIAPGFALVRATAAGVVGLAKLLIEPGPPASIEIQPDSTVLDVGAFRSFEAVIRDVKGNMLTGVDVTWSSTVPATGIVTAPGVLSGSAAGSTYMLVAAGDIADSARADVVSVAFRRIAAGGSHACASSVGHGAYCWGSATNGVLGNAATAGTQSTPGPALSGAEFTDIAAGPTHSCGLERGGSVYCWGRNSRGQLGDGTTTTHSVPVFVLSDVGFTAVAVGSEHTCALDQQGRGWCWGRNTVSQLGQPKDAEPGFGQPPPTHPLPLAVQLSPTLATITAGLAHTCGLTAGGVAYCWGDGQNGAVGDGQQLIVPAPALVSGGLTFASVSAGGGYSCGVTTGGAAYCWGKGTAGQLGTGDTLDLVPTAVAGAGGLTFASISAGSTHTCALTTAGAAYCWGNGAYGQLGQGSTASSATPVAVTGGLAFARISASPGPSGGHTCAVTADAVAYCWGRDDVSQLGDGGTTNQTAPTRVSGQ